MPDLLVPKAGSGSVDKGQEGHGSRIVSGSMGSSRERTLCRFVSRASQDLVGAV